MRLNINLASQPYVDARQFYARWGLVLGGVALGVAILLALVAANFANTRAVAQQRDEIRGQIGELEQQRQQAEAILNLPENRDVRDRSRFLNELIARKTFSWTVVLTDLERIMPPQAHVVSIRPTLTPENRLQLSLQVSAASRNQALELVRRMEASSSFHLPALQAETAGMGEGVRFDIVSWYVPPQARTERPAAEPEGGQ